MNIGPSDWAALVWILEHDSAFIKLISKSGLNFLYAFEAINFFYYNLLCFFFFFFLLALLSPGYLKTVLCSLQCSLIACWAARISLLGWTLGHWLCTCDVTALGAMSDPVVACLILSLPAVPAWILPGCAVSGVRSACWLSIWTFPPKFWELNPKALRQCWVLFFLN